MVLREALGDDFDWVVERHGTLYRVEHGYDRTFEAFVGDGVAHFRAHGDPLRERALIAEREGVRLGSAFLVRESGDVARLRFVIVDPAARGQGVGKQLLDACIAFARDAGYRRIVLGTHGHLAAALAMYSGRGFACVKDAPLEAYGVRLRAQEWALDLTAPAR